MPSALGQTPEGETQLSVAMVFRLQRLAGNQALTHVFETRKADPAATNNEAIPAGETKEAAPMVQRYQAGEPGHGGIEAEALKQAGFGGTMTEGEVGAIYFGNWLRDFSQFPNVKGVPGRKQPV